jgi:hypothetical protein
MFTQVSQTIERLLTKRAHEDVGRLHVDFTHVSLRVSFDGKLFTTQGAHCGLVRQDDDAG